MAKRLFKDFVQLDRIEGVAGIEGHIGLHGRRLDSLAALDSDLFDSAAGEDRLGHLGIGRLCLCERQIA